MAVNVVVVVMVVVLVKPHREEQAGHFFVNYEWACKGGACF